MTDRMMAPAFRFTDAGRAGSKRPRQKDDCTVRAIASAADLAYDDAYDLLAAGGRVSSRRFDLRFWAPNHLANGYRLCWRPFQAVKGQTRMNPFQFCADFPRGRFIVRTAKHVFAIVDGVVLDTTAPRPDRCIYGTWELLRPE